MPLTNFQNETVDGNGGVSTDCDALDTNAAALHYLQASSSGVSYSVERKSH